MSLGQTTLRFGSQHEADRWFDQLRQQWVVTATEITESANGYVSATAYFDVKNGAVVPAQRHKDSSNE